MHVLYDSESFAVLHIQPEFATNEPVTLGDGHTTAPGLLRHGFEIVDKRSGKEVYLDGSWAELFQQHVRAWQRNAPSAEEVESTLERYASLAHNPVLVH